VGILPERSDLNPEKVDKWNRILFSLATGSRHEGIANFLGDPDRATDHDHGSSVVVYSQLSSAILKVIDFLYQR